MTLPRRASGRRGFLWAAGGALGAAVTARASARKPGPGRSRPRRGRGDEAYRVRHEAARRQAGRAFAVQTDNGDERLLGPRVASYSKGLPHDPLGQVHARAYRQLLRALETGAAADFESVRIGRVRKLVNPQAGLCYVLEGPDPQQLPLPPAPGFASPEQAGEAAELYWMALLRDVAFSAYAEHPTALAAADDLSRGADFRGPKRHGRVAPETLFRDTTSGSLAGPFVSQFLWKDVPQGALVVPQRIQTARPGIDHAFTYARWLALQDGDAAGRNQLDAVPRYLRTGRDLGAYVHRDYPYQAFLNAALILLREPANLLDRGNPYYRSENQAGFCTFGDAGVLDVVAKVANCALKAAWYQKWWVHRRLRPEEYGGRVHLHLSRIADYPLPAELLDSPALERVRERHGSWLLPQAYPEGCPLHPSYPAGHAVSAGACATALKALFDDSVLVRDPVVPDADGTALSPYDGPELTIGGELDKLAYNVAVARNFAGIHWRTDASAGLRLGEAVALAMLAEMKDCFNERGAVFSLTSFDGQRVTV